jgi:hypothetical protein
VAELELARWKNGMSNVSEIDKKAWFAVFAILTGLLSVVFIASVAIPIPHVPDELLRFFKDHQGVYILTAIVVLVWVIAAIPFVVGLGALVGARSKNMALAAILLSAGGILSLGFGTFISSLRFSHWTRDTAQPPVRRKRHTRLLFGITCRFFFLILD